jgi:predicted acyl esterase
MDAGAGAEPRPSAGGVATRLTSPQRATMEVQPTSRMLRQLHSHLAPFPTAAEAEEPSFRELFTKHEYKIPMRDGVKLHTCIYIPKLGPDGMPPPPMPMLMQRSPYSASPYGSDTYPAGTGFFERYNKECWCANASQLSRSAAALQPTLTRSVHIQLQPTLTRSVHM